MPRKPKTRFQATRDYFLKDSVEKACERSIAEAYDSKTAGQYLLNAFNNPAMGGDKKMNDYGDLILKPITLVPGQEELYLGAASKYDANSLIGADGKGGQLALLDEPGSLYKYDGAASGGAVFRALFDDQEATYTSMKASDKARYFLTYRSMLQKKAYEEGTPERKKFDQFFIKAMLNHRYERAFSELEDLISKPSEREYVFSPTIEGVLKALYDHSVRASGSNIPIDKRTLVLEAVCAFIKNPAGGAGLMCFNAIDDFTKMERGQAWVDIRNALLGLLFAAMMITAMTLCIIFPPALPGIILLIPAIYSVLSIMTIVTLTVASAGAVYFASSAAQKVANFPSTASFKDNLNELKHKQPSLVKTQVDAMKHLLSDAFDTVINGSSAITDKVATKKALLDASKGQIFTDDTIGGVRVVCFTPAFKDALVKIISKQVPGFLITTSTDVDRWLDPVKDKYIKIDFNPAAQQFVPPLAI